MNFASQLLDWFHELGRKHLPWQENINPYRVWVSEIMLQQTQVSTVIPYYQRFMARFPTLQELAAAPVSEVLKYWAGLGYYARGRNLHKTAILLMQDFKGEFPENPDTLIQFPGIGKSTAHAILAIAFGKKLAILDGNVKRVLTRVKGITDYPGLPKIEAELWRYATSLLPEHDLPAYTQAIMDLGALICTRNNPSCLLCPMQQNCFAYSHHLTGSIPAAKPKRPYPIKTQICLVLYDRSEQQVFLEQRKDSGIWGGLNTPLFFEDEVSLKSWSKKNKLVLDTAQVLAPRTHKFTHFQLNFTPWLLESKNIAGLKGETLNNLEHAALPAPIKVLLQELRDDILSS
jgi:A/G-specific adenine glycosylase